MMTRALCIVTYMSMSIHVHRVDFREGGLINIP
jgi:hypothetical protein